MGGIPSPVWALSYGEVSHAGHVRHGFNIRFGFIKPPTRMDECMVVVKSVGHLVCQ